MIQPVAWASLAMLCPWALAQDPSSLQSGADFARQLAPKSQTQIINPTAVNAGVWGNNTQVAPVVPGRMGTFSNPTTDPSTLDRARQLGLTGLGQSAMDRCAGYKPAGDPVKDQECAAVNFLTQRCLAPNSKQQAVLSSTGNYQPSPDNCMGSYGQGQQHFDFANQISASDSAFAASQAALRNAPGATEQTCTQTTAVTQPAKFAVATCSEFHSATQARCSQTLLASVVTNQEPPTSTVYDCPIPAGGITLEPGDGTPYFTSFASMTMANYLRYPPSTCYYFVQGNINSNGYLGALVSQFSMSAVSWNQDYGRFELAASARAQPKCRDGSEPVHGSCSYRSVQKAWSDGCTSLESSAGIQIGTP